MFLGLSGTNHTELKLRDELGSPQPAQISIKIGLGVSQRWEMTQHCGVWLKKRNSEQADPEKGALPGSSGCCEGFPAWGGHGTVGETPEEAPK